MTVFFDNGIARVHSGFFTSWRVTYIPTGQQLVPNPAASMQLSKVWRILQRRAMRAASPTKYAAEDVLFEVFADIVIFPDSHEALRFLELTPDAIALSMIREANIRHVANRLS